MESRISEEILKKQAIEKIENEMNQNNSNSYVQEIGKFILQEIEKNPISFEGILKKDKSIIGSLEVMKNEARKNAVGGFAMFTANEGFTIVMNYFEMNLAEIIPPEIKIPTVKKSTRFEAKLEDFM